MKKQTVLIAGPGHHFAFELATEFARHDYTIALAGRNRQSLEQLASRLGERGVRPLIVETNFTQENSIKRLIDECSHNLPPWSCLIYNVKHSNQGNALTVDVNEVAASFESNVLGALMLSQIALNDWKRNDNSSILLSGGGYKDTPDPNRLALSVSKGALHSLALSIGPTFQGHEVNVKEIVIDGVVRPEGPIYPADLARFYWQAHTDRSHDIVLKVSA